MTSKLWVFGTIIYLSACGNVRATVDAGVEDGPNQDGPNQDGPIQDIRAPLLWYKFDEPEGANAITNSGTWPGAVTSVMGRKGQPGMVGYSLSLSDTTHGLVIADPPDKSLDGFSGWTAEAWINLSKLPLNGYGTLVKKNGSYICRLAEDSACTDCYFGQAIVYSNNAQSVSWSMPSVLNSNQWYHVACAYGAGALNFYWNGTRVKTLAVAPGALVDSSSGIGVGAADFPGENIFGAMDEFKMWDTARTDQQICSDACGSYSGTVCTFDGICGN
jgi:hypothetical protein